MSGERSGAVLPTVLARASAWVRCSTMSEDPLLRHGSSVCLYVCVCANVLFFSGSKDFSSFDLSCSTSKSDVVRFFVSFLPRMDVFFFKA